MPVEDLKHHQTRKEGLSNSSTGVDIQHQHATVKCSVRTVTGVGDSIFSHSTLGLIPKEAI